MGMYTELHFNVKIKQDAEEAHKVLDFIFDESRDQDGGHHKFIVDNNLTHKWFSTKRWWWMFFGGSAYFTAPTQSEFKKIGDYDEKKTLSIRCNIKNYSDEIEEFIDWVKPFTTAFNGDFLGFYRYEENETATQINK